MTAYNLQRWDDALVMFQRAYEELHEPAFLFNIAQCQRQLGQYAAANRSYRAYLAALPDAANRDQARNLAEKMARLSEAEHPIAPTPAPMTSPTPVVPRVEPATVGAKAADDGSSADLRLTQVAPRSRPTPVYKRWWLCTAVGVVVAGAAVGVGVGLATRSTTPTASTPLGTTSPF